MKVAVTQANYVPWLGYFDLLDHVDLWVNLDTVQVVTRSFIVRNRIKLLSGGTRWLTVALEKAPRDTQIRAARLAPGDWHTAHCNVIRENYREAPFLDDCWPWLVDLLAPRPDEPTLALHNERIIRELADALGLAVVVRRASDLVPEPTGTPQEKLVRLLRAAGGTSLWNFRRGVELGLYDAAGLGRIGIPLMKQEYEHPEYSQLGGEFLPYLSVLDLILNEGVARSLEIIRSGSRWSRQ
ncbi:MAG: WbqC family protein [Acidobacteriota bacterium]|nr:WbqC family protein [Acidobacteriota bacterium]